MDPSTTTYVPWDYYLVYLFESIMHVSVSDLWTNAKRLSSEALGTIHTADAVVSGALTEVETKIVDPLTHAIAQPIAGMGMSLSTTAHWLRMATYVGGGWLLYTTYQHFMDPYSSKRQIESLVDSRIRNQKRRRY